ncbi:MAG: hypothetical protein KME16_06795 [Scytolyngbya sp. HA4215-MV1]|nr:hypothetical protein [Scytolyngbya sp. HA4215-MV1]
MQRTTEFRSRLTRAAGSRFYRSRYACLGDRRECCEQPVLAGVQPLKLAGACGYDTAVTETVFLPFLGVCF